MRGFLAIYRKEMAHYFVSPVAYIVAGVFLLLAGFFFNVIFADVAERALQMSMQSMRFGQPPDVDVPGIVLRGFLSLLATVSLFVLPLLTIGSYAEEKSRGTMELLMTSPLRDSAIVLGKFFAALTLFCLMLLPTMGYVAILFGKSEPPAPWRLLFIGYLGMLLLGGVLVSIGAFISSLTENQLIAAVVSFGASLMLWVVDATARGSSSRMGDVLQYLSIVRHYEDFTRGVVDTSHLVFYVSFIVFGVFLTLRAVDSLRWRRA